MTDDELIAIYMDRFINQTVIWGKQWVDPGTGRYGYAYQKPDMDTKGGRFIYEPVTPDLVRQLFNGKVSCAWCAVDCEWRSKWMCFDSDYNDGQLDRLKAFLRQNGWHFIGEGAREGRPGHLWLFFDNPVAADVLIMLAKKMVKAAGAHIKGNGQDKGLEPFPKYAAGLSQVRAPFSINLRPEAKHARGWFEGIPHNIRSQIEWLASQPLNNARRVIEETRKKAELKTVFKQIYKSRLYSRTYKTKNGTFDFIAYAKANNFKLQKDNYKGPCRSCKSNGHDSTNDHLSVHAINGLVKCWNDCSFKDILTSVQNC